MMQSKRFRALAMVGALTMAVCTGIANRTSPVQNSSSDGKFTGDSEDIPDVRRNGCAICFF